MLMLYDGDIIPDRMALGKNKKIMKTTTPKEKTQKKKTKEKMKEM